MPYNFPDAPTLGQAFQGYIWDGEKWVSTAIVQTPPGNAKKNYIINGAMMVNQENGGASGTISGFYPVDQFNVNFSNSGTQTSVPVQLTTPGGSPYRIRVTATVPDAAVAAGDFLQIVQTIEGARSTDLKFGLSSAKTVTLQFGVKAPAGTYCVALSNNGGNTSYVAEYVIASGEANTDVIKSITIPGSTTGTWETGTLIGMYVVWTLMAGTTFRQTANTWGATPYAMATANQFNFMGTVNNVFELFDVSLTEGSIAPPFLVPDYATELAACQRYWQIFGYLMIHTGYTAAGANFHTQFIYPTTMHAPPTTSIIDLGSSNCSSISAYLITPESINIYATAGTAGAAFATVTLQLNARM